VSLIAGAEIDLTIEKAVTGGRMLARHDGQVVLVAGAIPGERVRATVERVAKQVAFADTRHVIEPSGDRREGQIDWTCGGSAYAHIAYARQLTLKSELIADAFARVGKLALPGEVPVLGSTETGYRTRARLHARDGHFGFFREGTHQLCDAALTRQLADETIAALRRLENSLVHAGLTSIVSCELTENVAGDERAVLLELTAGNSPHDLEPIEGLSGLVFAVTGSSRLVMGFGSPFVNDAIPLPSSTLSLVHHVQSFFQGNRFLLASLAERVLATVPGDDIIDLYAGVGLFALAAAAEGRTGIVAVEGERSSGNDLEANAEPYRTSVAIERVSVERYLQTRRGPPPSTLVLDPPRTGMSREAISGIVNMKAPRVVYVSCDLATVARDVKRFVEAGYSLDHIEAFDLFPNTAHVETLITLTIQL
jgi:23S rRNA (uracil1939-C5)-methyltransferase